MVVDKNTIQITGCKLSIYSGTYSIDSEEQSNPKITM